MKHLDDFATVKARMDTMSIESTLLPEEYTAWQALAPADRDAKLRRLCEAPLDDFSAVYRLYFRTKWLDAFRACSLPENPTVLEIGSGESDMIPTALSIFAPGATYITANMNETLTANLLAKTKDLPVAVRVIADDAANIARHLPPQSVDLLIFEHSLNDIMEAILAEQNGLDTTHSDWFDLLPTMINLMNAAYQKSTLDTLRAPLSSLIRACFETLKPGGFLAASHYMFQYDLDLGHDPVLWQEILTTVRPWIADALGAETTMPGFDPQWWLFLKKDAAQ